MINLNEINKIFKTPFVIFEVKNFLNDCDFNKIKNEFFDLDNHLKRKFSGLRENKNLKFSINSLNPEYKKYILSQPTLKHLHQEIVSQKFLNYLFQKLNYDILSSKIHNLLHIIKLLKFKQLEHERIKKFSFIDLINIKKKINIQLEFSWMKSNAFLKPHTDAPNKLISLMLYFPEDENYNTGNMGTIFWDYNTNNYKNIYIDRIDEKMKILHQNEFEGKTLFGFIKNHKSWHSVPELHMPENKYRKSININLLF